MKRIGFVAIVLMVVVVADLVVGAVTKEAIMNVRDVGVNQTNTVEAFMRRTSDVLILGPSTANHHYDCKVMEDELGMNCYNAGRDGQNVVYDAMVLEGYLERCTPKLVVMDMGGSMLSDAWMGHLKDFYCYYGMVEKIDRIIEDVTSPMERLQLRSGLYRYNKTWEWLLKARTSKEVTDMNGYRPLAENLDTNFEGKIVDNKVEDFVPAEMAKKYLDVIVNRCKEKNIRLVLTLSPVLVMNKQESGFEIWLQQYCSKHQLQFLDYARDKDFFDHPEWFYDMSHLNKVGAEIFTRKLVSELKR